MSEPFRFGLGTLGRVIQGIKERVQGGVDNVTGATDRQQQEQIDKNTQRSNGNGVWNGIQQDQIQELERLAKKQGKDLEELKGDLETVADALGLDSTDPNIAEVLLRFAEIENAGDLSQVITETMDKVDSSSALSDDQKASLNDKLVELEQSVKLKYQDPESSFNFDDKNLQSLISILGSVETFVDNVDSEKKKNPDYEVSMRRFDNYSQRLSNAIGRIDSGLRVQKEPDGSLALA